MVALPLVEQMALSAARETLVVITGLMIACSGKDREQGNGQSGENVAEELHDDS